MQHLVWSLGIRCLHWTLAVSVMASFFTHEIDGPLHEWPGYVALTSAALRLAWGMLPHSRATPARYSRFADFVKGPAAVWRHSARLLREQAPRYLGHSPLAAALVLALLLVSALAGLTGWMLVTDRFFGVAWVMQAHDALGYAIVPLVLLHWALLALSAWQQRENLLAAMLRGKKAIQTGSRKAGKA